MALYRQIAGLPAGNLGFLNTEYFLESINNGGLTPVDYTTPIQTIQPSQPLIPSESDGTTTFRDPRYVDPNEITLDTTPLLPGPEVSPVPTINPSQPDTPTTSVIPAGTQSAITNNILPLVALAGVVLVAIKGNDLLPKRRKIALLGGLGLLYYGMAKNKLV